MTKREVIKGFKFTDKADRQRLCQWIDDDKMGTARRKALILCGSMASGKSTLLRRISEYKGEAPVLLNQYHGRIVEQGSLTWDHAVARELSSRRVVLLDDALFSVVLFCDIMDIVDGKAFKIRKLYRDDYETYLPTASMAVAVRAIDTHRAEEYVGAVTRDCYESHKSRDGWEPFCLVRLERREV